MPVVGTAGHVDHGKSTLLEKLTGKNPMHLPEEFDRGLTIELGFGYWQSPSGIKCGIVDVPGHGHFIRNMAGGAFALDAVIFVVAADDGWKPQSEEHLFICQNARIPAGIVALNKVDLAPRERINELADELAIRLDGTFLEDAPIVKISALTGQGLGELEIELEAVLRKLPSPRETGKCRIWIDRSFKISGAGIVITGTLKGGSLKTGDQLSLLPGRGIVRARKLEMYGQQVDSAPPGTRLAINLVTGPKAEPVRGQLLAKMAEPSCVSEVWANADVPMSWASGIKSGGTYLAHIGTMSVGARVYTIGPRVIEKGKKGLLRIVLEKPVPIEAGDRFLIFSSAKHTVVAGCITLVAGSIPRSSRNEALYSLMKGIEFHTAESFVILKATIAPASVDELHIGSVFSDSEIRKAIAKLTEQGDISVISHGSEEIVFRSDLLENLIKGIMSKIAAIQRENKDVDAITPSMLEMPKGLANNVKNALMASAAENDQELAFKNGIIMPCIERGSDVLSTAPAKRIMEEFTGGIGKYPNLKQLYDLFPKDKRTISALITEGHLVRLPQDILFPPNKLDKLSKRLKELLSTKESISVSDAKNAWGVTRKHAIPLLEHFDKIGVTTRSGSERRKGPKLRDR
ncbi:selenocysteine-specific translation elongation factor [bacterium]|nr:selenocysteine-specific translation elongation factor [bacterium]